jgi:multicomponent Na+:H+ antiporter subunit D
MTIEWIHPGAILILGSLLVPFLKGRLRQGYLLLLPVLAFISVMTTGEGSYGVFHILHEEVVFGKVDSLSTIFGYVFSIAAFISILYGIKVKESGHHIASFVYAGSALGVTFAGDFISLFAFWEFMAFSSVFLILYRKTKASYNAAYRYILIHVFGGVCLMGGMKLIFAQTGSIELVNLTLGSLGTWLMLIGILVNCAAIPFNAWLPDAYPNATISGAVFLSAFTTKSAIYVLIRTFSGTEILIVIGVVMALWGVIYAMLENDIRRVQAYSIISQVGYMVVGIGIGTHLAINGVVAHAFAHILYKGLLFMATGSIIYMTGKSKMTELGGLVRYMPKTFILYMFGALAISAFPLFSGFVSKSVILSAAGEEHLMIPYLLLTVAAAGTFLYTGLKIPYLVFFSRDRFADGVREAEAPPTDPPGHMLFAMGIAAAFCVLIGLFPGVLYQFLPYDMHYAAYTPEHIVWSLELLLFAALGFCIFRRSITAVPSISLDTDWFYRMFGLGFMCFAKKVVAVVDDTVSNAYKTIVIKFGRGIASSSYSFDSTIVDGVVNGVARFVVGLSASLRRIQTGQLHDYAMGALSGILVLISLIIILN